MEWPVLWCSLFLPSLSFPCHGYDTLEERDLPIFLSFPVSLHSQVPLHWDPYNKVTRGRPAWSWAIFLVNLGSTANMMVHVWLFRGRDTLNSCSNQCDLNCSDGNCVLYQKCFSFSFTESKRKAEAPVLLLTTLTCLHCHCPPQLLELLRKEKAHEQRAASCRVSSLVWVGVVFCPVGPRGLLTLLVSDCSLILLDKRNL